MLCNLCNKNVFEEDSSKCTLYNEFYSCMCVSLNESAFRRMSKVTKSK